MAPVQEDFVDNFSADFADTAPTEQACAELTKLEVRGGEIDEYISAFEHLLVHAGREKTRKGRSNHSNKA